MRTLPLADLFDGWPFIIFIKKIRDSKLYPGVDQWSIMVTDWQIMSLVGRYRSLIYILYTEYITEPNHFISDLNHHRIFSQHLRLPSLIYRTARPVCLVGFGDGLYPEGIFRLIWWYVLIVFSVRRSPWVTNQMVWILRNLYRNLT